MSRRPKSDSDLFLDTLICLPWRFSAAVGGISLLIWGVWVAGRPGFPLHGISGILLVLIVLIFSGTAGLSVRRNRRARVALLQKQTLQDLQAISWQDFEESVGAYYRKRGFSVVHTGEAGPDGGFDLVLRKDGERILVQCKRYRGYPVDVQAVREFFGVVVSEGAHRGIFITTSRFTAPAMEFGLRHASLELIPGLRFAEMVHHLRQSATPASATASPSPPPAQQNQSPCCPKCDTAMVSRTARRGPAPGRSFWGCSNFPDCNGTREMA